MDTTLASSSNAYDRIIASSSLKACWLKVAIRELNSDKEPIDWLQTPARTIDLEVLKLVS